MRQGSSVGDITTSAQRSTTNTEYHARVFQPGEIDDNLISAWADLEARADVPNAFLSPYFVMPAFRHIESPSNVFGLFVEKRQGGSRDLIGAAFFHARKPTRRFPLPHLAAFETVHSYLSGFLVDRDHVNPALRAIYGYVAARKHRWHGLAIHNGSPLNFLNEEAAAIAGDFRMVWNERARQERAVYNLQDAWDDILSSISKGLIKDYRRHMRRSSELGALEWRVARGTEPLDGYVEELIRLEHMGWKGAEGTSILSDPAHSNFFKEMIREFNRAERACFTKLSINDEIISTTSSIISGKACFGFKIGWNTDYTKYGPGIMNYMHILEHGQEAFGDLEYYDSCSAPDSYINRLWPGRREIVEGVFTFTNLGTAAMKGLRAAKRLKTTLRPKPAESHPN